MIDFRLSPLTSFTILRIKMAAAKTPNAIPEISEYMVAQFYHGGLSEYYSKQPTAWRIFLTSIFLSLRKISKD